MEHRYRKRIFLVFAIVCFLLISFNKIYAIENNAGDFNVEGGTANVDWTYDSENNILKINTSGSYTIIGDNQESDEQIEIAENFKGMVTIRNINAKKFCVDKSAGLSLYLDGTNVLREGLRFDSPKDSAYLIIDSDTDGTLVARGNTNESGIGGGSWQDGGNISIIGGNITAIGGRYGAGIGTGYGSDNKANNITISGGTVTAIGGQYGTGIGTGFDYGNSTSNIVINGGSVKVSGFGTTPTDGNGNIVYLTEIDNLEEVNIGVIVDDNLYRRSGSHSDNDNKFYLYLSGSDHTLKIKNLSYHLIWKEDEHKFLHQYSEFIDYALKINKDSIDEDFSLAYDTINDVHYILKDGTYTISQDENEVHDRINVANNVKATIILDGVNINSGSEIISLGENTNLTIKFNDDNYIETSDKAAAISTTYESSSLTFDSDTNGILNVTSKNGVAIGSMSNTYNITFNGGTINAKGNDYHESDIGIGLQGPEGNCYAKNIVINGGVVNCLKTALGSSYAGNKFFSKNCEIIINGGTVTAPIIGGSFAKYDDTTSGYVKSSTKVIINGGSVKGSIQAPDLNNDDRNAAYDKDGNRVYLAKIDNLSGIKKLKLDEDLEFVRESDHLNDGAFYLYLTGNDHTISINDEIFCKANWLEEEKKFVFSDIKPKLSVKSKYGSSIIVNELDNQDIYGNAEYSIDNNTWQSSNVFEGLDFDTQYTIYARYKGKDNYLKSDVASVAVKTKKSGKDLITNKMPLNLVGIYGQKLADINLPDDWTWDNEETDLMVSQNKYLAYFDIANYTNEYDFLDVVGDDIISCDFENSSVKANLNINVSKAKSTLSITSDLNKTYDKEKITEPVVEKTGSSNNPIFSWFVKEDNIWKELDDTPINVGEYKVLVTVDEDDNYNGLTAEKTFEIYKAIPEIPSLETYNVKQYKALSSVALPDGFVWKDQTLRANILGMQTFKAIYTPSDSINYQSVELDVLVNVVENEKINEHIDVIENKEDNTNNINAASNIVINPDKKTELENVKENKDLEDKEIVENDKIDKKEEQSTKIEKISEEEKDSDLNILLVAASTLIVTLLVVTMTLIFKHER